jgi:dienelactone hydrolase
MAHRVRAAWADTDSIAVTSPAPATLRAELSTPRGAGPFFAAAAHPKTLPQIDGRPLAAIGYSHGGSTVLRAPATEARDADVDMRAFLAANLGG